MEINYAPALKLVLVHEGLFVNHPADPGGPTMKGVTQAVYDAYRDAQGLPRRSVEKITNAELNAIYKQQYWDRVQGDRLPSGVDYSVFDFAVNSGVSRAVKMLQRAVGVVADGVMGDLTLQAVCAADPIKTITALNKARIEFLRKLKTFKTFGRGWTARVASVVEASVRMVDGKAVPVKVVALPSKALTLAASTKAPEDQIAQLKTNQGKGYSLAGIGATGNTALSYAQQVKPHIGETVLGRLALVAFIIITVIGSAFIGYSKLREMKDKGIINWSWIK